MNDALVKDDNAMDPDYADKTDEQILASKQFEVKFYSQATKYPSIQKIFNTYNEKAGRTAEATAAPIVVGGKKKIGTAMRNKLIALGFEKDLKGMSVADAQAIIDLGKTKEELKSEEEAKAADAEKLIGATGIEIWQRIGDILGSAKDLEELKEKHNEALDFLDSETRTGATGWTVLATERLATDESVGDVLEKLVAEKRQDLQFSFEFEDIKKNQTIIMKGRGKKDGKYILVTKVDEEKGLIYGRTTGSKSKSITPISRADVKTRVKFVYKKGMEDPELELPAEDITPEDDVIAADNLDAAKNIADSAPSVSDASDVDDLDDINDCNKK